MADTWTMIGEERRRIGDFLGTLGPEQWSAPSWCAGWTVKDVAAHIVAGAQVTPGGFFAGFARSGFNFDKFQAKGMAPYAALPTDRLLEELRGTAGLRKRPPGPARTPLGEVVDHSLDIASSLGAGLDQPTGTLVAVADFYKSSQPIVGTRKRIAGLRLVATDADWSHGTGPEVTGPLHALVSAMTGRKPALDGLAGSGVDELRKRA